jgi:hypothetical protein
MSQDFDVFVPKEKKESSNYSEFSLGKKMKVSHVVAQERSGPDRKAYFKVFDEFLNEIVGTKVGVLLEKKDSRFDFCDAAELNTTTIYKVRGYLCADASDNVSIVGDIHFKGEGSPSIYSIPGLSKLINLATEQTIVGWFADSPDDAESESGLRLGYAVGASIFYEERDGKTRRIAVVGSSRPLELLPVPPIARAGTHYAVDIVERGPVHVGLFADSYDEACAGGGRIAYVSAAVVRNVLALPTCPSGRDIWRVDHD